MNRNSLAPVSSETFSGKTSFSRRLRSFLPSRLLTGSLLVGGCLLGGGLTADHLLASPPTTGLAVTPGGRMNPADVDNEQIANAFAKQGIRLSAGEAARIRPEVILALTEAQQHGIGNSKVDFAAVQIAQDLGLDTGKGSNAVRNIVAAFDFLLKEGPRAKASWLDYFNQTIGLVNDSTFIGLLEQKQFHPVYISWEDIGRDENSSWGDRISDVGIWVRRDEKDSASAELALSVRRSDNFTDKVLMVPSEKIKIHQNIGGKTVEKTLPQRLKELGLSSKLRDKNVIVSNQFAIVPVPSKEMKGTWKKGTPPRAAFNFSIFPYGSTNYVITDVIEGSHGAVVGPGDHQMLYANVKGKKAPFTASRAEDRQDLLKLERELKAQGMDVDVQRYYLIQIPLKPGATGVKLSNMGNPPGMNMGYGGSGLAITGDADGYGMATTGGPVPTAPMMSAPAAAAKSSASMDKGADMAESTAVRSGAPRKEPGLTKVAIGTGEAEGKYFGGSGFQGKRAEEPIRVTVVYFVTPIGQVTPADMENFTKAFTAWDSQAIWGGSFVTKEAN